ncbi:protein PTHB1 [Planococcus citri]|uniref:protein PTHB1 n=1 Tax=Planococcus citri TaxID=170843 RepID=UPI0031F8AAC1
MSLFNAIDLWSTRCGVDETFSINCLVCVDYDESGRNKVIVGSLSGLLQIYEFNCTDFAQTSFKPSDLLLETQLPLPIIHVATGQLVSGSRAQHIAIAHPTNIKVYSFASIPGSTEHGDQFDLRVVYEHALQHSIHQLIVGSFGGVKGRDFICSCALDGTLTFFEQETLVHETRLPSFLLPNPIVYVPEFDSFVTFSADWCIESYRYQDLVNTSRKKIVPTWSYNLGDSIIDIQTLRHDETFIVVLSEHNLTCFNTKGVVRFTKRLQYSSLCFHIYINDVTNELMMLNVSDSGVLFVYERTTLRWSAKLPTIPIHISKADFGVKGALLMLSDQGDLNCCYLGTKPSLFVAPPLENSITNYKNINTKLEKLHEQIKEFTISDAINNLTLSVSEREIQVETKIVPFDKALNQCQLVIDLLPSRPLISVHVAFEIMAPFSIQPESYTLSTLQEKSVFNATIMIEDFKDIVPSSLDVTTIVSYMGKNAPCMIRKRCSLPARIVISACLLTEEKNCSKITLSTNKPPLPLSVLFQEFRGNQWTESGNNDEVACFCLNYNPDIKCTVSLSKLKHGYEFSTNSMALLYFLLIYVMRRSKSHKSGIQTEEEFKFDCKNVPRNELMKAVENHVNARNEICDLQSFLEKLSSQFRLIQRRFLIKLKEKTNTPITALQTLYNDIYDKLSNTIQSIEEKQRKLIVLSSELHSSIELTLELIAINSSIESNNLDELREALTLTSLNSDSQGWEERTYANVIHLLKTKLSDSDKDQFLVSPTADKSIRDFNQLWKLLCTAFDRVTKGKFSLSQKLDQNRRVTPITEDDETAEEEPKQSKFRFLKNEKLLSKRLSLAQDSIIDQLNEIN